MTGRIVIGGRTSTDSSLVVNLRSLEPAASYAAGKHVRVTCNPGLRTLGFTPFPGATSFSVNDQVCRPLLAWQRRRPADVYEFAFGLMVLAHEAQHSKGIADETEATCRAIALLPVLVRRYFPLRGRTTIRNVVNDARAGQLSLGPAYNARRC